MRLTTIIHGARTSVRKALSCLKHPILLTADSPTLAEVLKSAGYRTYMSGKWHVSRNVQPGGDKSNWPLQRGFDEFTTEQTAELKSLWHRQAHRTLIFPMPDGKQ